MRTLSQWGRFLLSRALTTVTTLPLLAPVALGIAVSHPALAQNNDDRFSSILVEAASGKVLQADDPDALRHPASLAKLMTLYLTFEALRDRRISLGTIVPVSAHAASMEPTKLGLLPGMRITVEQAILGLVTKSANDAAAALGELLGGSEEQFAQMMTLRARALGMAHTTFANASGLPAPHEWTTARDMAILARHLIYDFPRDYHYFSTPSFVFHGMTIFNHDTMLKLYAGVDGMKTGYTDASGHNLVTSAVRDGVRLIGVELGAGSNAQRDNRMAAMLNLGFQAMNIPTGPRFGMAGSQFNLIASARAATVEGAAHFERPVRVERVVHIEQPTPVARRAPRELADWSVQVGVYREERLASEAAHAARHWAASGELRVEPSVYRRRRAWKAEIAGLTASEARGVCAAMAHHRMPCLVLGPEARELASR